MVRGVLPYAALAAVGIVGYSWLNKRGYFNGIKDAADTVFRLPQTFLKEVQQLPDKIPDPLDFTNPPVTDTTYKDDGTVFVQRDPNPLEQAYDALTSSDTIRESFWTDTPVKYLPGVAIRNGITKFFGN